MSKLFAHRGFREKSQLENSVASLQEAVANGFEAIEFDLWFLQEKIVLKHDRPKPEEIGNLPTLQDYFKYKNDLTYWLDFKNLDLNNCQKALNLTKEEILKAGINIDQIYFAPFVDEKFLAQKIFDNIKNIFASDAKIVALCQKLKDEDDAQGLCQFLNENNIKFLSIAEHLLSEKLLKIFHDIEIFAWTVNDLARIFELENLGVKNFATDKITPLIYGKNITSKKFFGSPQKS
ncbi:MAG: glycerophosphodiester phosphodiesterase [Rickettsiales bacterium]|nr:glycerophosphodiester phosphodiesterase [Rickettsiales bacterium]